MGCARALDFFSIVCCGALERDGEVCMHHGGADTVIGLAVVRADDLVDFVLEHDFCMEQFRVRSRWTESVKQRWGRKPRKSLLAD